MKGGIAVIIFIVLIGLVGAIDDLLALQGKVDQSGTLVESGDIVVEIWDDATAGNLIYNSTSDFNGAIQGGFFDIVLGSGSNSLTLNLSQTYYMDIAIEGQDIDWGGDERRQFQATVGRPYFEEEVVLNDTLYTKDGNVGINDANPGHTLSVEGNLSLDSSVYASCTALETDSAGGIVCGTDDAGTSSTSFWAGSAVNEIYNDTTAGVGIGTNNPSYKLEVNSVDSALNVSGMLYVNSSSVGIGTDVPGNPISISGVIGITDNILFDNGVDFFWKNSSGTSWSIITLHTNNNLYLTSPADADMIFRVGGYTERMRIDSSGNVGIGTTSPNKTLTILGNLSLAGPEYISCTSLETDAEGGIRCGTDDTGSGGITNWDSNIAFLNESQTFAENNTFDENVVINTRLGVGIDNPDVTMHVNSSAIGGIKISGNFPLLQLHDFATENKMNIELGRIDAGMTIYDNGFGGVVFYIENTTGNVGIGTTTVNKTLTILGNLSLAGPEYISCTSLETDAEGGIRCGADAGEGGGVFLGWDSNLVWHNQSLNSTIALWIENDTTLTDAQVDDFAFNDNSSLDTRYVSRSDWTTIDNYPSACAGGQYVSGIGDTLTCSTPSGGTTYWTGSGNLIYNDTTAGVGIGTNNPSYKLEVNDASTSSVNLSGALYVDGSERLIGIGTDSPFKALTVLGKAAIGDSINSSRASRAFNVIDTNAVVKIMRISDDSILAAPAFELIHENADGARDVYWDFFASVDGISMRDRLAGEQRSLFIEAATPTNTLYLSSGGNVGIRTASPNKTLTILGNLSLAGPEYISCTSLETDAEGGIRCGTDATGTSSPSFWAGSAVNEIYNDTTVGVGIGTNNPSYKLEVNSVDNAMNVSGMLYVNSSSVGIGVINPRYELDLDTGTIRAHRVVGSSGLNLTTTGNVPVVIYTSDTERMRIDSSGNVGIGTNNPDFKLDVIGTIKANDSIKIGTWWKE